MTMPTAPVVTTNLDAGIDSPASARTDLLDAVQKLNQMIAHISTFAGTLLDDVDAPAARTTLGVAPRATRIDVASASTVNLTTSAPDTDDIRITGTTTITAVTVATGRVVRVTASAAHTLTNNANIVTQTGANIVCAAGDTYVLRATAANVVEVFGYVSGAGAVSLAGNQTIAGVKTFGSTPIVPAQSMVRVDTQGAGAAGNGTTNTKIPRWTTIRTNQGTDITYTDSAANGASFTINTAGNYSINFTHSAGSAEGCCITMNESAGTLSSNAALVAVSEVLQFGDSWVAGAAASVSWTGHLAAGSVIRPHTSGGLSSTPRSMFTISRTL